MNIEHMNQNIIFFNTQEEKDRILFDTFKKEHPFVKIVDTLEDQLDELYIVNNPLAISHEALEGSLKKTPEIHEGVWVYIPWKDVLVRILKQNDYQKLRLSRNKDLITDGEQSILETKNIGIIGLNVGNPGAIACALEGIGSYFKLADFDPLSLSNLNRFRAGISELGVNKATISMRQMLEINPYLHIDVFEEGITQQNIFSFLEDPKIDILIEEVDNLKIKIQVRELAKQKKIPVVMVTGNGENVIVDIERYDQEPDLEILSGFLDNSLIDQIKVIKKGEGTYEERIRLARDFMGEKYLDERLLSSFEKVGKTLAGIPQIAESSFLRGAVLCHFVKHILLRNDIPSGRYEVSSRGVSVNI